MPTPDQRLEFLRLAITGGYENPVEMAQAFEAFVCGDGARPELPTHMGAPESERRAQQNDAMQTMLDAGHGIAAVARHFGVTTQTIYNRIRAGLLVKQLDPDSVARAKNMGLGTHTRANA